MDMESNMLTDHSNGKTYQLNPIGEVRANLGFPDMLEGVSLTWRTQYLKTHYSRLYCDNLRFGSIPAHSKQFCVAVHIL